MPQQHVGAFSDSEEFPSNVAHQGSNANGICGRSALGHQMQMLRDLVQIISNTARQVGTQALNLTAEVDRGHT